MSRVVVATLAVLVLALAACSSLTLGGLSEQNREVDAQGLRMLTVRQGDGELEVVGLNGLGNVRVSLRAGGELADDALRIRRDGDRLVIEQDRSVDDSSRLRVEAPSSLVAGVGDGGGASRIEGLAGLVFDDASGTSTISDVGGDVEVRDSSGTLTLSDIGGQVHVVEDGSGTLEVSSVDGDVVVDEDTSGPLAIQDVRGNVDVGHKSRGDISVLRVGGDLVVSRHDAGALTYEQVAGSVAVPKDEN